MCICSVNRLLHLLQILLKCSNIIKRMEEAGSRSANQEIFRGLYSPMVYGIIHMSPQWDPVKNPITPTRVIIHFNIILSSSPNVFHMALSFQAKTLCNFCHLCSLCSRGPWYNQCSIIH